MKHSELLAEEAAMRRALINVVVDLKRYINAAPQDYIEPGTDDPSIDVRLCVDDDGWIFRTGDASYDPYCSKACGASCVGLDTNSDELLEDLLGQVMDQLSEQGDDV